MTSDHPRKPRKPSDIAQQFRELQQLRKQVHEAELDFSRNSADVDVKVEANARRPQNPSGRTR
jgi:hypothetical protein